MALLTNMESTSATDDSTVEAAQISRLKRYDRRVEEWLASLKDEAEQRSPEVLGALAAKAKDVAEYLDKMAERARSKQEVADDSGPSLARRLGASSRCVSSSSPLVGASRPSAARGCEQLDGSKAELEGGPE
jgi:hypothetical protein